MFEPRESNRSGNSFLVSGMLAALGASACCEGGLKFLCGSQPEIRDGSDQEEPRRAGVGMQERADSTSFWSLSPSADESRSSQITSADRGFLCLHSSRTPQIPFAPAP